MPLNAKYSKLATAFCCALLASSISTGVLASGGASGPKVAYVSQGHIGEVVVNPYQIAPLTAVIRNGGYQIKNASVHIVAKPEGQPIGYQPTDEQVRTHGGIPVFGLYPDYLNTVEVEYDRIFNGKTEHFKDRYQFYAAPVFIRANGTPSMTHTTFDAKVEKTSKEFNDRLYFINNLIPSPPDAAKFVWNNPMGGSLEWALGPENAIGNAINNCALMSGEILWDMPLSHRTQLCIRANMSPP